MENYVKTYQKNGWVIIRNFFKKKKIEKIKKEVTSLIKKKIIFFITS